MTTSIDRPSLPKALPLSHRFIGGVTGVLLVLCLSLVPTVRLAAQVPTYTGTQITTFTPTAINAAGQMAGTVDAPGTSGSEGICVRVIVIP